MFSRIFGIKNKNEAKRTSAATVLGFPMGINLLPFLELNEVPSFARVCKSTHKITQLLTSSEKVKQRYLQTAVLKLLKEDAEQLLDKHPIAKDAASRDQLDSALKNLLQGNASREDLNAVEEHEFKYSATNNGVAAGSDKALETYRTQETLFDYAGTSIRAAGELMDRCNETTSDELKKTYIVMALACSIASGFMAGVSFVWRAFEDRKGYHAHNRLKKRVKFFKDNLESKPDKKEEDDDDENQSRLGM